VQSCVPIEQEEAVITHFSRIAIACAVFNLSCLATLSGSAQEPTSPGSPATSTKSESPPVIIIPQSSAPVQQQPPIIIIPQTSVSGGQTAPPKSEPLLPPIAKTSCTMCENKWTFATGNLTCTGGLITCTSCKNVTIDGEPVTLCEVVSTNSCGNCQTTHVTTNSW
jgi:hypothetical protein